MGSRGQIAYVRFGSKTDIGFTDFRSLHGTIGARCPPCPGDGTGRFTRFPSHAPVKPESLPSGVITTCFSGSPER
jgi:hypothetical protein